MAVCKRYSQTYQDAKTSLEALRASPALQPIPEAADRIACFCRCFGHLFAENVGMETSHKDVMFFAQYQGKQLFERMTGKILTQANSFWHEETMDVIRCAGKSEILRPQRLELQSLLGGSGALPCDKIERCLIIFGKMQESARKVEVEPLAEAFRTKLFDMTNEVLKMQPAAVPAGLVDSLLKGLNRFAKVPGSLSLIKDLQTWLEKNSSCVAMTNLIEAMQASSREKMDYTMLSHMLNRAKQSEIVDDFSCLLDGFLLDMCHNLLDKACWFVCPYDRIAICYLGVP